MPTVAAHAVPTTPRPSFATTDRPRPEPATRLRAVARG